ncbi:MAG: acyl transferase [Bacteroidota bacterium]|nr:acyl transferase [Bacteroidota bacterium]MDP4246393.1 acyl transferase [Bacteroidota bacterium]MDP4255416.1 acyl transferase [Bacteroidota bacterium]MDP4259251.1 acyl transferase [Bacteroidota bacterium]
MNPFSPFEIEGQGFTQQALELFRFQAQNNPVYREFLDTLRVDPAAVTALDRIPFLPVRLFKERPVRTTDFIPEAVFESSGTTGSVNSRHEVKDLSLYRNSCLKGFELNYGPTAGWCILGLLPSYLERSHSSLVFMVDELIRKSGHADSGFYLYDHEKLFALLSRLEAAGQKTLLIGVSFALLDFSEEYSLALRHTVVMETGGMKGRRRELVREELHAILASRLGVPLIHAEYGMTELLSQAYSKGNGLFTPVPWMKVLVRSEDDPFEVKEVGEGVLNIVDLANVWSCSFLATDDVGKVYPDGNFDVSGRMDNSDIRGCSLLVM